MRPRLGLKLLLWAAILALALAVISGDPVIVSLLGPILVLAFAGLLLAPPNVKSVNRMGLPKMAWTGEEFEVELEVQVEGGAGMVVVFDTLPEEFEMTGSGNYRVFWIWRRGVRVFKYSAICRKRGVYQIQPTHWRSWHGLYLRGEGAGLAENGMTMTVLPKPAILPYSRATKERSRLPQISTTLDKVGIATSDFRELRQYHFGDPLKAINWKATARRLSAGMANPVTNQYESEARRTVWIFTNASATMLVGDTLHNPLELCLRLSMGAARYFLRRGARVGLYAFGADAPVVEPGAGNRQLMRISRVLAGLKPGDSTEDLLRAVQQIKKSLVRETPLSIVFTRLDLPDAEALKAGVRQLSIAGLRSRRRTAPMIVGVNGFQCLPTGDWYEKNAQALLYLSTRPLVRALQAGGARVLEWQPAGEPGSFRKQGMATWM